MKREWMALKDMLEGFEHITLSLGHRAHTRLGEDKPRTTSPLEPLTLEKNHEQTDLKRDCTVAAARRDPASHCLARHTHGWRHDCRVVVRMLCPSR
jgi:hypothetical protein